MFLLCSNVFGGRKRIVGDRRMMHWYRATSFNEPCGPWRETLRHVREDLVEMGLGSFEDDRCFYLVVPGGIDRRSDWADYDDA